MEMKKGYKHTEIGVIPEDWNLAPLNTLLKTNPKYGINSAAVKLVDNIPIYIRITDISEEGYFSPTEKVGVKSEYSDNYYLENGDLVFARTGASVGKSYLYDSKDGRLVYAGFLIKISPDERRLLSDYLAQYVKTKQYWNWVQVMSMRSGQPGINGVEYGTLSIPLPPTKTEQTAIANALSDTDTWIQSLSHLIEKKRLIKQGAMQTLLNPYKNGCLKEGWIIKKISSFTNASSGGTPSTLVLSFWNGDINWMSSGELNYKKIYKVSGRITEEGLNNSATKIIPKKCVLIGLAGQGKTRGTVAINYIELCTNQSIAAIYPCSTVSSEFLYFNLDGRYNELRNLSTGDSGRGALNLTIIKNIDVWMPENYEDQEKIAIILSNMDSEISELESKLTKAKQIKQGMMQQLLTGKIRLVTPQQVDP